jgi:hypothetical protein
VPPDDEDYDHITICAFEGDPSDGIIADVIAEITSIEDEADARLIAASPAMAEALEALMAASSEQEEFFAYQLARAALRLAKEGR